jgi:cell fate regulator YaaT (PSP1 superfamily)
MRFIQNTTGSCCGICIRGCSRVTNKLNNYDWLNDIEMAQQATEYVEVQFKNTRKGYYVNHEKLLLKKGDVVAVEASPGHDVGVVTLTGQLVLAQMQKNRYRSEDGPKKVYRFARQVDIDKYEESKAREHETMILARQLATELGLNMKIGDVEFQGDGNKAIFYYIADERVDFRELIKVLADAFRVRIEMKQIGARQEAGRIGGIGPCGRELCCSQWTNSFVSVATDAARFQDLSMNPQKLAGQCAKLKCCINYEVDIYVEANKQFPSRRIDLQTKDSTYFHYKNDIFKMEIIYSTDRSNPINLISIPIKRAFEVINMNKNGKKPFSLLNDSEQNDEKPDSKDILEDNISRFDKSKKRKRRPNRQNQHPQQGKSNKPNRDVQAED